MRVVTALILASGQSKRMGRPKALLPCRTNETFVCRLARTLRRRRGRTTCSSSAVPATMRFARRPTRCNARFVENPKADQGQLSSVLAGLDAVDRDSSTIDRCRRRARNAGRHAARAARHHPSGDRRIRCRPSADRARGSPGPSRPSGRVRPKRVRRSEACRSAHWRESRRARAGAAQYSTSRWTTQPFSVTWTRRRSIVQSLTSLLHDVRLIARLLTKSPAYALATTLTLALAIGANSAIFSAVYGVLLKPLPIHDPSRLVVSWGIDAGASSAGRRVDVSAPSTTSRARRGASATSRRWDRRRGQRG